MSQELTLFGAPISPFVRKVRLVLAYKGLDYQQVNVVPFSSDIPEEFKDNSPLGKIPLFKVGEQYISDSEVICAYLEKAFAEKPLLPNDPILSARALWFSQYASSVMMTAFGAHLFAERILAPFVFKRAPIEADIKLALETEIPAILTYLESELNNDYLVGDSMTFADIMVGGMFMTLHYCNERVDASQYPKLAAYVERLHNQPIFANIIAEEKAMMQAFIS
ncbi:glutathione S-transferase family protein [Thalassotalea mangrovi]|uniref:Glutathione S-transferase family protein n=1 Tax=Thalassotalea mangrovi TaxID=2572245 RepID=A0A4U1B5D7_9GAMM|nr:glutathione S-transferase family protein [Thalassotalea mangrovi]TKB45559.1 glutathione S-transferase family protein [Thalassotalea mangrovi]